ncbi:MAG: 50S ribosomal protein L3 [Acetobacteraceae bacterium]|nr:50S ribosomal protein L3 [Acetobacteraceae bacterium]
MTQVFGEGGEVIPVTVVRAGPFVVVRLKTPEKDGYSAVQLGFEPVREGRLSKPEKGSFSRAGVPPVRVLREFRLSGELRPGQEIRVDAFSPGERVDVTGVSRGKGFAGGVRRWHFKRGPMAHGSKYHRGPGSLQSRDAARVFKGRKLPGHLGGVRVTVRGLQVVRVDPEHNLLLLKGAVPGPRGGLVAVQSSV